jgi:hypothetical protein
MSDLSHCFDQFVRERTYLNNVTPKTRDWYQTALAAIRASAICHGSSHLPR